MIRLSIVLAWLAAASAAPAREDPTPPGALLAGNACEMCHQLPDGPPASAPAPQALAASTGPSPADALRALLQQPQHVAARSMVDDAQLATLADYLNGLR
jgi:hypothetical protein